MSVRPWKWSLVAPCLLLLSLAACGGPEKRSAINGDLAGSTPATTTLDLEASEPLVVEGQLVLTSGGCQVTLRDPSGTAAWANGYAGAGTYEVGPYTTRAASAGTWTLEVVGTDGETAGTYEVSLTGG